MKKYLFARLLTFSFCFLLGQNLIYAQMEPAGSGFGTLLDEFEQAYRRLDLPGLRLSYQENFAALPNLKQAARQEAVLERYRQQFSQLDTTQLSQLQRLDRRIILFELNLQLDYLALAQTFREKDSTLTDEGIYHQYQGTDWYRYYIRKWTSTRITPKALYRFGIEELERVKKEIKAIQEGSGMDSLAFYQHLEKPEFFISDPEQLETLFRERKAIVKRNLTSEYPDDQRIPDIRIDRGTDERLVQTPGFYRNNTFYYNLFSYPFNLRQLDWLFMHEGNPGHHFQVSYAGAVSVPEYRRNFWFAGFAEGWAAYIENHGKEIGLYQTAYDSLGKWEWDIVRSIRVPLDVGINYYGWTNAEALAFWKKHIPNQDQIAQREIDRMRRWPAQVHTYKVGAAVIEHQRQQQKQKLGAAFDPVEFHRRILEQGAIPIAVLPALFD